MTRSTLSNKQVWGAVLSMSLCAFALVASEFLPVSLLTPIAHELSLSEGQAGQAISVSGFFAVLTSLSVSSLTRRLDRKKVILTLTALMVASGILVSVAPTYTVLMLGRALLGVSIGGCWSMSTAVMMRIAPEAFVPRAIAVVQGGSALATAVAAPAGSFLGSIIGWRGAFFCVVPLAAIALIWQALTLPKLPAQRQAQTRRGVLQIISDRQVLCGVGAVALLFMGQFSLFTYLRPFLETVTKVDVSILSFMLLVIGAAGLGGTVFVGSIIKRNLHGVLITIPLLMSGIAVALMFFGESVATTAVLLAAWGLIATSAPVGWFTWLSETLPGDAEAGGGLMVAVIQLAITLGATLGGLLYDSSGYRATFGLSAGLLLAGAVLAAVASRVRCENVGRAGSRVAGQA
ncbi:major facilitator transporter [Caballeronia turbans]|uniref:MFS transporter n=1 Tax=Caballeronia sp. INML2 TaxID=2921748 RepID=UPI00074C55D2|nr:MFS transporter [Caballeronia sp. INML2]SAL55010.1 major facilitator transporter [Caballeronia turbans]